MNNAVLAMYSTKIEKTLKKKNISPGDRIAVSSGGEKKEGILMPRIEVGDENALILKLDSGYNIGAEFAPGMKIEKMREKKALGKVPSAKVKENPGLPKVSIISTGGTIAARVDYSMGGVKSMLKPDEILSSVPELQKFVGIKSLVSPFTIPSEDMTPKEWQNIAQLAAEELNKEDVKGLIVTHGTDILHYTAAALSFMLRNLSKPVALVGAQRSPDRGSFDGAMNLVCAAHYATSDNAEVATVMHATKSDDYCIAIRGTKARKMHSTRRDAFRPVNDTPLAKIWPDGKIELLQSLKKRSSEKVVADTKFEEKIALFKSYPGSDPALIDFYVEKEYRGIVVEAYALGHVPLATLDEKNSWLPALKRAIDGGMLVAFTTQCPYGRVDPYVYEPARVLHKLGVLYCEDMLPETAYVKLGWVLAHAKSAEEAKKMMLYNYAGELNTRLTENDFIV
jgi:glutamyl-tRNA(Gln) amidotransferase subunit D